MIAATRHDCPTCTCASPLPAAWVAALSTTEIETRGWTAYATMMNEAQALEAAAKRLRERAAELHRALDPPAPDKEG